MSLHLSLVNIVNGAYLKIIYFQSVSTGLPLNVYNILRIFEKLHKNTPVVIFIVNFVTTTM